jgi:hypothetical protein
MFTPRYLICSWRMSPSVSNASLAYKRELVARFLKSGNPRAAAIVQSLPEVSGELDRAYVDALLLRAHCELQRSVPARQWGENRCAHARACTSVSRASEAIDHLHR